MPHVRNQDAVATIALDGALDYAAVEAIRAAVLEADADDGVRLLVLDCESEGDAWPDMGDWPERLRNRRPGGAHGPGPLPEQDAIRALRGFLKPSLALLRGKTLGLALDFACVCDLRIAAADATVGDPRIRQGRAAATGIAYLLPKLIGQSQAMRVLLLGETFTAAQAKRMGLIHEVVEASGFAARAEELCAQIAALPTRAWAVHKMQVLPQLDLPFEAAMTHSLGVRQTHVIEDRVEGMRAWRERRPPRFAGR